MPTHRTVRNFTPWRRLVERAQERLYGAGWPARLGRLLGMPVHVSVRQLEFDHGQAAHPKLRIAFGSDLHAGPTTHPTLLANACSTLAGLQPDVVLWGGDFVSLDARHIDQIVDHMSAVRAGHGCYAVLGNHDLWVDYRHLEKQLERAGVQLLTNRNARLAPPFDAIWICGLDDVESGHPDAKAAVAGADGVRVVLMHSPDGAVALGEERFELAFCGHTHGGQIALPGGRAIVVPAGTLSRRYARGVHHLSAQRNLVVSLGVGNSGVPFRAFAPPEVIDCTLTGRG